MENRIMWWLRSITTPIPISAISVSSIAVALLYLAVVPLKGACRPHQEKENAQAPSKSPSGDAHEDVTFQLILRGDGRTPDGTPTFFTSFKASDGFLVYKTLIEFSSVDGSDKMLEAVLKSSLKTLRSEPETDKQGRQTGRRVLVLVRSKSTEKPSAIVAFTDGVKYVEARSDSLDDLLEFERRFLKEKKATSHSSQQRPPEP